MKREEEALPVEERIRSFVTQTEQKEKLTRRQRESVTFRIYLLFYFINVMIHFELTTAFLLSKNTYPTH